LFGSVNRLAILGEFAHVQLLAEAARFALVSAVPGGSQDHLPRPGELTVTAADRAAKVVAMSEADDIGLRQQDVSAMKVEAARRGAAGLDQEGAAAPPETGS
jgi:hypothetical protein